jgi:lysophospholipase L1-like esterase
MTFHRLARMITKAVALGIPVALSATLVGAGHAGAAEQTMLVIGDSYSSGEGLAPYLDGSPEESRCHRSNQSYGSRAVEQMTGVTVINRACTGAKIDDYLPRDPSAAVPAQRAETISTDPDYIALTLGGNDADWAGTITSCASGLGPGNGQFDMDDQADCAARTEEQGDRTVEDIVARLKGVYQQILTDAPKAQVRVLLYPPLFPPTGDSDGECIIGQATVPPLPGVLGFLGGKSVDITLSNHVTQRFVALERKLNDSIVATVADLQAADPRARDRLAYVDSVAAYGGYDGHTVNCGRKNRPTPWINQITLDFEKFTRSPATFHPRSDGHRAMGAALAGSWSVASPLPQHRLGTGDTGSALAAAHRAVGYWRASQNGAVTAFGDGAHQFGDMSTSDLNAPVVGIAATPSDGGYWLVAEDGGVFAFGDAPFRGAATDAMREKVTGIAAAPSGNGYWVVAADGAVKAFGDAAAFDTSTVTGSLASPVAGIAATPKGAGAWLVTQDGSVVAVGDAPQYGSMQGQRLNAPMVGITATPSGGGYWLTAADGGVFSFGDARFFGSTADERLQGPVVGIAAAPSSGGYWLTAADGGIFAFGDAPFLGR